MPNLDNKIPPPIVALTLVGAMWGTSALGPVMGVADSWRLALTVGLIALGLWVDLLGLLAFRRSRTTVNPLRPERSSSLVTKGIYRHTRNPMYVGMCLLLSAWAVYLNGVLGLLGPVLFVLYITRFQIQPEERALQSLFGQAFVDYCAQVRRWV
jgi:protein-S-isoprenylcysteine O-methyltransferase Ste14